jgi:hypothetical protein
MAIQRRKGPGVGRGPRLFSGLPPRREISIIELDQPAKSPPGSDRATFFFLRKSNMAYKYSLFLPRDLGASEPVFDVLFRHWIPRRQRRNDLDKKKQKTKQ